MAALHQLDELQHVVNELVCIWDEVLGEDKHLPSAFSSLQCQIVLGEGGGSGAVEYMIKTDSCTQLHYVIQERYLEAHLIPSVSPLPSPSPTSLW